MLKKGSPHYIQGTLFKEDSYFYNSQISPASAGSSEQYTSKIETLNSIIRRLRSDDLSQGHCFMIFDEDLPEDEAYYEYPDGTIRIEKLNHRNIKVPRILVKVLNKNEITAIRKKHFIAR